MLRPCHKDDAMRRRWTYAAGADGRLNSTSGTKGDSLHGSKLETEIAHVR